MEIASIKVEQRLGCVIAFTHVLQMATVVASQLSSLIAIFLDRLR